MFICIYDIRHDFSLFDVKYSIDIFGIMNIMQLFIHFFYVSVVGRNNRLNS